MLRKPGFGLRLDLATWRNSADCVSSGVTCKKCHNDVDDDDALHQNDDEEEEGFHMLRPVNKTHVTGSYGHGHQGPDKALMSMSHSNLSAVTYTILLSMSRRVVPTQNR